MSLATHATSTRSAPTIPAKSESAKRGQENDPIQASPLIASNAAPATARPFLQPLHFGCGFAADCKEALYCLTAAEPPERQANRALSISAPDALAGKPQDEQRIAKGSFGPSQAKQRQRYGRFMMLDVRKPGPLVDMISRCGIGLPPLFLHDAMLNGPGYLFADSPRLACLLLGCSACPSMPP
jgi:hypothetical protein